MEQEVRSQPCHVQNGGTGGGTDVEENANDGLEEPDGHGGLDVWHNCDDVEGVGEVAADVDGDDDGQRAEQTPIGLVGSARIGNYGEEKWRLQSKYGRKGKKVRMKIFRLK